MAHNAADPKKVASIKSKQKNERDQELDDIKTILSAPAGMRFFKRFLEDGKIFSTTFTGNSNSFFFEGMRNLALKYFNDICEAAPEKVADLMIRKKDETDEEKKEVQDGSNETE